MIDQKLDREYDKNLIIDQSYLNSLPDLQNSGDTYIQGQNVKIQRVGIHNFNLPLNFLKQDGTTISLKTSVCGTVSLEADKKGINMSRITRTFYDFKDKTFSLTVLGDILQKYKQELDTFEADITLNFSYPILQKSLRSNLDGWQFYNTTLEGKIDKEGKFEKIIHFDFVYSSACPCSYELGRHAQINRNKAVVPHSQRSIARISVKFEEFVWIEELQQMCLEALQTETQVMVKREDEQAFAELNGSYLKFVEDACRLLYEVLNKDSRILDFKVACTHLESLHSHSAVGVLNKGVPGGFLPDTGHDIFRMMEISHTF